MSRPAKFVQIALRPAAGGEQSATLALDASGQVWIVETYCKTHRKRQPDGGWVESSTLHERWRRE